MKNVGKKVLVMLLAVLMLCSMTAVGVSAAPSSYTNIYLGDTVDVTVSSGGVKYLRFVPEEDGEYVFYATGDMDTYGALLDTYEDVLASDDDGGEDYNFYLSYYLYAGNVYYLSVSLYGSAAGTFSVTVDWDGALNIVPDAELFLGEYITASNIPVDTASYFLFNPDESGWYTFYTTGSADTYAELWNYKGEWILYNDNTVDEENFSLTYYLEGGETYYVVVWGYGGWTVNYELHVARPSIYNLFANAATISLGEGWDCTVASSADHLYFRFMPEVSGEYTFYSTGEADPYCYFYDAVYNEVYLIEDSYEYDYNFGFTYYFEAGNPYYFMVGEWEATASFSVVLEEAYVEAPVIEIAAGETATVTADEQQFVFVPERDGWYCLSSAGDCDTAVEAYLANGERISNNNNGDGKNFRLVVYANAGEECVFYAYNYDGYGEYTVSVNAASESNLFPGAGSISAGSQVNVALDLDSGSACYRFVPTTTGTYTLYTTGESDSYGYLYDLYSDTITISDDYFYSDNHNFVNTYDFVAGETYYFVVSAYVPYDESATNFKLHLKSGEFGELKAEQIRVNETKTVTPEWEEDSQCYAFVPTASGWYHFAFKGAEYLSAEVYNALEITLIRDSAENGVLDVYGYCEAGQVYYVSSSSYSETDLTYTVNVSLTDGRNIFPDAVTIVSGQSKTMNVEGGQCYRFVPTTSGVYTFASSGDGDPYCSLYNITAGTIGVYDDDNYDEGNYHFSITDYFRAGQEYYFYVNTYESEEGTPSVTLTLTRQTQMTALSSVNVSGLRAPAAGESVGDYMETLWDLSGNGAWYVEDAAVLRNDNRLNDDASFKDGLTYTVGLAIASTDENTVIASDCGITVNAGTISGRDSFGGFLVVYVDFTVSDNAAAPGDVNGDDKVNNRDLGLIQQYLGDWDVSMDLSAADVNDDGKVNNRDLGLVQQYLGDWDVELK